MLALPSAPRRRATRRRLVLAVVVPSFASLIAPACKPSHVGPQASDAGAPSPNPSSPPSSTTVDASTLRLAYHETFDAAPSEPTAWTEDTYGDASPYHVDAFDDDGEFFREYGGTRFADGLRAFRSFRKSFTYGADGWLTVELYGRDDDRDGRPESGGRVAVEGGRARVVSARHHDAALVRSTRPLPARYRVEVTVSNIRFGDGIPPGPEPQAKVNGYDGDESAAPWWFDMKKRETLPAVSDNGVYFLCITDYARPAPHNNVFIHHHRKVVIDTDNNFSADGPWSSIWNPTTGRAEPDGQHYVGLFWLDGEEFGPLRTGNAFVSLTPDGLKHDTIFADKYLDGETYVFAIERDQEAYALSATGRFAYGGQRTYTARRRFLERPVTWHYNQTAEEGPRGAYDQKLTFDGKPYSTWPADAAYPDHFIFGDPHINFYEGSAEYDDLKLFVGD